MKKTKPFTLRALVKAIRPHHFLKNLLLFLPIIVSHQYWHLALWWRAILGFVCFTMAAASVYLINDIVDAETDRLHPDKKNRPIANGTLGVFPAVLCASIGLFLAGLLSSIWIGGEFSIVLTGYYIITTLYSFVLKKSCLLDVCVLSLLYTLRVIAGIVAIHSSYSFWLIGFSFAFFLSLALVKRCSELVHLADGQQQVMRDKSYAVNDLRWLKYIGFFSAAASVVVFIFYINSSTVKGLYTTPVWLWGIALCLLVWIARVWLLAIQGRVHDDPVVFSIQDKVTWALIGMVLILFLLSVG